MAGRLSQLVEGSDGKLDEQAVLSIVLGLTLAGLTIFEVTVRGAAFDPQGFAVAGATFLGGSLGALTVRSRWSKEVKDAGNSDQPSQ